MAFFVGIGLDTPYCPTEAPCASPLTGDGIVVHGTAGNRYCLAGASAGGCTVAVPDAVALWTGIHVTWGQASAFSSELGLFTQVQHTTVAGTAARLSVLTTAGGPHQGGSTRHDFHPWARMWAFLSSFSRGAAGEVSATLFTHVQGEC